MSETVFTDKEQKALEDKDTLPRFFFLPLGALGITMSALAWPVGHWAVRVAWGIFTSYWLLCWTSCFHETVHQTLCGSKRFSIWLGRLLGTVIAVPYTVYRETHIRHHAYLNTPADWELWPYSDPRRGLWFRRVFVWVDLLLAIVASPVVYGRIYFHPDSPIQSKSIRRAIFWEYVAVVVFWATILSCVAVYGTWVGFLFAWGVPHFVTGIWQTGRKMTEHLGMASYDPFQGTRTVVGKSWFTRVCTYLNFDIFVHGPHHRHPRLAHNELRRKIDDYVRENPDRPCPLYPAYWRATLASVPWMFRNPGVGVNVGAPPPEQEGDSGVQNFDDVNEKYLADA